MTPHPTVAAAAVFSGGGRPPPAAAPFLGAGGGDPPPTLLQQGCPLGLGGVYHRANALAAGGSLGGVDPPLGCFPYIMAGSFVLAALKLMWTVCIWFRGVGLR